MSLITLEPSLHSRLEQAAHDLGRPVEEIVAEAVGAHLRALDRQRLDAEIAAFEKLHPRLKETHLHQYVAIYHGQVVDVGPDFESLFERVHERLGDVVVLIRQVKETPDEEYVMSYSLRLEPQ